MSKPQYSNASSPNFEQWAQQQQQRHDEEKHTQCCYYAKQSQLRPGESTNDLCFEQQDCSAFEHCDKCQSESTLILQTLLHEQLILRLTDGRLVEGEVECIDSCGSLVLRDVTQTLEMHLSSDPHTSQDSDAKPLVVKLQSILIHQQHIVDCRVVAEDQLASLLKANQSCGSAPQCSAQQYSAKRALQVKLNYRFPESTHIHEAKTAQTLRITQSASATSLSNNATSSSKQQQSTDSDHVVFNSLSQLNTRVDEREITIRLDSSYAGSMFTASDYNGIQLEFADASNQVTTFEQQQAAAAASTADPISSLDSSASSAAQQLNYRASELAVPLVESELQSQHRSLQPAESQKVNRIVASAKEDALKQATIADSSTASSDESSLGSSSVSASSLSTLRVTRVRLKSSRGFVYAGSTAQDLVKGATGAQFDAKRVWRQGSSIWVNLQGYTWKAKNASIVLGYDLDWDDLASAVGDPQITGFLGQSFQVHGAHNHVYSMISSQALQYNARFVFRSQGRCREGTECFAHPGQYLGEAGLLLAIKSDQSTTQVVRITVTSGAVDEGLTVKIDDAPLQPDRKLKLDSETELYLASPPLELLIQSRDYKMRLQNSDYFLNQQVSMRPALVQQLSRYDQAKSRDRVSHVNRLLRRLPHGILGQTWSSNKYDNKWKFIEGDVSEYLVSSDQEQQALTSLPELHNRFVMPVQRP